MNFLQPPPRTAVAPDKLVDQVSDALRAALTTHNPYTQFSEIFLSILRATQAEEVKKPEVNYKDAGVLKFGDLKIKYHWSGWEVAFNNITVDQNRESINNSGYVTPVLAFSDLQTNQNIGFLISCYKYVQGQTLWEVIEESGKKEATSILAEDSREAFQAQAFDDGFSAICDYEDLIVTGKKDGLFTLVCTDWNHIEIY